MDLSIAQSTVAQAAFLGNGHKESMMGIHKRNLKVDWEAVYTSHLAP